MDHKYWAFLENILENGCVKEYTGIGSRAQTSYNFRFLVRVGMVMAYLGRSVRSGAAHGADEAFELGLQLLIDEILRVNPDIESRHPRFEDKMKQNLRSIYLPWNNFRKRKVFEPGVFLPKKNDPKAREITRQYHPNKNLKDEHASLMDRNSNQILGLDLDSPTGGVICHTPDGADGINVPVTNDTGGTGQAIRICNGYNVPVSNLGDDATYIRWLSFVEKYDLVFMELFGKTTKTITDDYLNNYIGFKNVEKGDLVNSLKQGTHGLDAMVHGCNCHCTMGSGIAKSVVNVFPQAHDADCKTKKGDKWKMGTYSSYNTTNDSGHPITVINAYTQFNYGRMTDDMKQPFVDYEKLRKVFVKINSDFAGKTIGIPKIGAGLAGGEWYIIARLISESTPDVNIVFFVF